MACRTGTRVSSPGATPLFSLGWILPFAALGCGPAWPPAALLAYPHPVPLPPESPERHQGWPAQSAGERWAPGVRAVAGKPGLRAGVSQEGHGSRGWSVEGKRE